MDIYKKSFFNSLNFIVIVLSAIISINYFVDPGNQFHNAHSLEAKVAKQLLSNHEVMINANYNERALQKLMLSQLTVKPDILLLGSSHSLPISQRAFPLERFYNASVSSASLEDDIALYYLFQKKGWQPKTLVLCLDSWLPDINHGKEQWKTSLAVEFNKGRELISGQASALFYEQLSGNLLKYSQLLSIDYLKASANKFSRHLNKASNSQDVISPANADLCPSCYIRRPDGARLPSKVEEAATAELADFAVSKEADRILPSSKNKPQLNVEYTDLFESFVQYLIKHHVEVVFYFPPFEPQAYQKLVLEDPRYRMVHVSEQYFLSIARKYHLKIQGSYNPAILSLTSSDFIDNGHLKIRGVDKIFLAYNVKTKPALG